MVTVDDMLSWLRTILVAGSVVGGWMLWLFATFRRDLRLVQATCDAVEWRGEAEAAKAELRRIVSYWQRGFAVYEDDGRILEVDLRPFLGSLPEKAPGGEQVPIPEAFRRAFGEEKERHGQGEAE